MLSGALTVGVEEEFLLLDPVTGENVPAAESVFAALPAELAEYSRREFRHSMIEMVTPVCAGLAEVAEHLSRHRRAAADAAVAAGCRLAAVGATPVGEPRLTLSENPRYQAIAEHYGPIVRDPAVCGCHVHIGVPDRETAIRVSNFLRPWLPVVQAIGVNSPFHGGADSGHASWRAMQLDRWPSLGPAPWFESAADFDRLVEVLVASGAMLDENLVLWHARPSRRYPTIEIRVADVSLSVADAVVVTGLIRGLVATARQSTLSTDISDVMLQAAHWNAAHAGLDGTLLDLRDLRPRPAWDLVEDLVTTITPALRDLGDLDRIETGLARLRKEGTGAQRQRDLFRRTGSLPATLQALTAG